VTSARVPTSERPDLERPDLARPEVERPAASPEVLFEEARRRRRRRWAAGSVTAAVIAAAAFAYGGSGGGGGSSPPSAARGMGGSAGSSGLASTAPAFPGAPQTQAHVYGVSSGFCPLAVSNRYLPPRSGCVTVVRADINGDGRPDLIVVYSRLTGQRLSGANVPADLNGYYDASSAHIAVYFAGGGKVFARIGAARAVAVDAVAHVNDEPGREVFLDVSRISSGAGVAAYGFHHGRLVSSGVTLGYGGDSDTHGGFNCIPGPPPRVVTRNFELIGPTVFGWWKETEATYVWHGAKLVQTAVKTFKEHGAPPTSETDVGSGCKTSA
jgi:hypothetical protein